MKTSSLITLLAFWSFIYGTQSEDKTVPFGYSWLTYGRGVLNATNSAFIYRTDIREDGSRVNIVYEISTDEGLKNLRHWLNEKVTDALNVRPRVEEHRIVKYRVSMHLYSGKKEDDRETHLLTMPLISVVPLTNPDLEALLKNWNAKTIRRTEGPPITPRQK